MNPATASQSNLVVTKLGMPRVNQHMVERERLNMGLDASLRHRLTIVTAPAGYGKSTAVAGWLLAMNLPVAWVSLGADDNNPDVFWRYVMVACGEFCKGLASAGLPADDVRPSTVLINALAALTDDFCIVLDDFRHITNPEILHELTYLADYLPPSTHLILISRAEPRLNLGKAAIGESLLRIGVEDLRFRAREIAAFFAKRGLFLSNDDVRTMVRETEGWAAALIARATALTAEVSDSAGHDPAEAYTAVIDDYLATEVASEWSEEQHDFLLMTSVLGRFCGPLCTAVTGMDGTAMLIEIAAQDGFLVPLDDDRAWYRFRTVFSEFLRRQLARRNAADSVAALHAKAANWFQDNGYVNEAIDHYLEARLHSDALPLIAQQVVSLVQKGQYAPALAWVSQLPAELVERTPIIVGVQATYYADVGDFKRAAEWLTRLQTFVESTPPGFPRTTYLALKANLAIRQGDTQAVIELIREATTLNEPESEVHKDFMDLNTADVYLHRSPVYELIRMVGRDGKAYWDLVEKYRSLIAVNPGYAPAAAGEMYYERDKWNQSFPYLWAAIEEALKAKCPGALVPAVVTIARMWKAQGDWGQAFRIIDEYGERLGTFVNAPHWKRTLAAFKARLHLDAGETVEAEKWLAETNLDMYQEITRSTEFEFIVFARLLIEQSHCGEAQTLLQRLLIHAEGLGRTHSAVEILILMAVNARKQGAQKDAKHYIERALALGRQEGYLRIFADEGPKLDALLVELMELSQRRTRQTGRDKATAYVREILAHIRAEGAPSEAGPGNGKTSADTLARLTPREKTVLRFLLNALTNREIADQLGVTVRTVKAHTSSVYTKMGVRNRAQCIKVARDLTLV